MLSLIFGAIQSSQGALRIEGWYVAGIVVVLTSFVVFIFKLLRSSAAADRPFRGWSIWTWAMFVIILVGEGLEHLSKVGIGDHS